MNGRYNHDWPIERLNLYEVWYLQKKWKLCWKVKKLDNFNAAWFWNNLDSIWWRWISAKDQQKIYIKWNETPHKFSERFLVIAFFLSFFHIRFLFKNHKYIWKPFFSNNRKRNIDIYRRGDMWTYVYQCILNGFPTPKWLTIHVYTIRSCLYGPFSKREPSKSN